MVPTGFLVMQKIGATSEFARQVGDNNAGIIAFVAAALAMVVGSLLKICWVRRGGEPTPSRSEQEVSS
jgi:hypothetical protein